MFIKDFFPKEDEIPLPYKITTPLIQNEYLINGELIKHTGKFAKVLSPVCLKHDDENRRKEIGEFPLLTEKEALMALEAATLAYANGTGQWPSSPIQERIKAVESFAARMKEQRDEVVKLLMWETGKPFKDSEKEFDRTVEYIIDTIKALKKLDRNSSGFEVYQGIIGKIKRGPVGVVLCMGPFNYPLNETFTTLIPALIMGNTVVFKPAKIGVLLLSPLISAFKDCFPKGVINIVYGRGRETVSPIMAAGKVDILAFIGTSKTANSLKKMHPKSSRLRTVLALEAKNPAVVLPHADLDLAVKECVAGSLSFNGQRCTALKVIFVHASIVNSFLEKFSRELESLKRGMPWEDNVFITPLPEPEKPEFLTELINDAKLKGAKVYNKGGGETFMTYFEPAILYPVNKEMKIYHEEQFGPVVPVVSFSEVEEVLSYVRDSDYGQQLSLFGRDQDQMGYLIDQLVNLVCRININSQCQRSPDVFPFNGRKDSAQGTLSVEDALRAFSIRTVVATKDKEAEKIMISGMVKGNKSRFMSDEFIF